MVMTHQPIPGERDPGNLTKREPGAMGGEFDGADIPPDAHLPWLDSVTAEEHAREGGMSAKKARKLASDLAAGDRGRPAR
jgi:hypothetical protein